MIEAKCNYCGQPTLTEHKIFEKSCLCDTCDNRDDLTYYRHKWMPLEEAEELERVRYN